ncbi:hypothetical protein B9Z55_007354 [Caenorhabditis nigoni]|uniref:Uncharacterized protein n=1 Tax=Caenorhabditis nigoni TaxID=1611254 RepID=A0A2G5V990_9PELO|nr:hypothetical protein B9Z55_007354 [Caenorhabditis nigoni]
MSFPNSPEPPVEAEASATGNIENSDENLSEKPESTRQDSKAEQDQSSKNQGGPGTREESQTTPDDASRDSEGPEPPVNPPARREVSTSNSEKLKNLKAHFLSTSPRWSPSFSVSPVPPAPEVPEDSKSVPATPTLIPTASSSVSLASMFPTHRGISMRNCKPADAEQSQEASRGESSSGESRTDKPEVQAYSPVVDGFGGKSPLVKSFGPNSLRMLALKAAPPPPPLPMVDVGCAPKFDMCESCRSAGGDEYNLWNDDLIKQQSSKIRLMEKRLKDTNDALSHTMELNSCMHYLFVQLGNAVNEGTSVDTLKKVMEKYESLKTPAEKEEKQMTKKLRSQIQELKKRVKVLEAGQLDRMGNIPICAPTHVQGKMPTASETPQKRKHDDESSAGQVKSEGSNNPKKKSKMDHEPSASESTSTMKDGAVSKTSD